MIEVEASVEPSGSLFVVSGPSGAGKGTIIPVAMPLMHEAGIEIYLSQSWTSRLRRPDEPKSAYNFVSREEFEQAITEHRFLEWAEFLGNYYGTPIPSPATKTLLEIEVEGAQQIAERSGYASTRFAYIIPENPLELVSQLFGRNDRMPRAEKVKRFTRFVTSEFGIALKLNPLIIINDDITQAATKLARWVQGDMTEDPKTDRALGYYNRYNGTLLGMMNAIYLD